MSCLNVRIIPLPLNDDVIILVKFTRYLKDGLGDAWALQVKASCSVLFIATFSVASDENLGGEPPMGSENSLWWQSYLPECWAWAGLSWAQECQWPLFCS